MNLFTVLFGIIVFLLLITPVFLTKDVLVEKAKLHKLRVLCDYVAFTGEPVEHETSLNIDTSGKELRYKNISEQCVSNVGVSSGRIYVEVIDYLGN